MVTKLDLQRIIISSPAPKQALLSIIFKEAPKDRRITNDMAMSTEKNNMPAGDFAAIAEALRIDRFHSLKVLKRCRKGDHADTGFRKVLLQGYVRRCK